MIAANGVIYLSTCDRSNGRAGRVFVFNPNTTELVQLGTYAGTKTIRGWRNALLHLHSIMDGSGSVR